MKNQNNNDDTCTNYMSSADWYNYQPLITFRNYERPDVWITVNRQRQKFNNQEVYLRDNTNFELEIFNREDVKMYVDISLSGKSEKSKLILRPGERVFVERFFGESKKFNFSTYFVDRNNPQVDKAISMNGKVRLEFYMEDSGWNNTGITYNPTFDTSNPWSTTITTDGDITTNFVGSTTSNVTLDGKINIANTAFNASVGGKSAASNTATLDSMNTSFEPMSMKSSRKLVGKMNSRSMSKSVKETGEIKKGENSNQKFDVQHLNIDLRSIGWVEYHIKPESENRANDNKVYCTNCGTRQRKYGWKFCPTCGNSY